MIDSMRVWTSDGAEALGISIANSTGELRNVEVVTYRVSDVIATGIEYTDGSRALLRDSRVIVQERWLSEDKSSLHDLAGRYGVSAERIRQVEKNALKKLRGVLEAS